MLFDKGGSLPEESVCLQLNASATLLWGRWVQVACWSSVLMPSHNDQNQPDQNTHWHRWFRMSAFQLCMPDKILSKCFIVAKMPFIFLKQLTDLTYFSQKLCQSRRNKFLVVVWSVCIYYICLIPQSIVNCVIYVSLMKLLLDFVRIKIKMHHKMLSKTRLSRHPSRLKPWY